MNQLTNSAMIIELPLSDKAISSSIIQRPDDDRRTVNTNNFFISPKSSLNIVVNYRAQCRPQIYAKMCRYRVSGTASRYRLQGSLTVWNINAML